MEAMRRDLEAIRDLRLTVQDLDHLLDTLAYATEVRNPAMFRVKVALQRVKEDAQLEIKRIYRENLGTP
jgi:hypothetical protein